MNLTKQSLIVAGMYFIALVYIVNAYCDEPVYRAFYNSNVVQAVEGNILKISHIVIGSEGPKVIEVVYCNALYRKPNYYYYYKTGQSLGFIMLSNKNFILQIEEVER